MPLSTTLPLASSLVSGGNALTAPREVVSFQLWSASSTHSATAFHPIAVAVEVVVERAIGDQGGGQDQCDFVLGATHSSRCRLSRSPVPCNARGLKPPSLHVVIGTLLGVSNDQFDVVGAQQGQKILCVGDHDFGLWVFAVPWSLQGSVDFLWGSIPASWCGNHVFDVDGLLGQSQWTERVHHHGEFGRSLFCRWSPRRCRGADRGECRQGAIVKSPREIPFRLMKLPST